MQVGGTSLIPKTKSYLPYLYLDEVLKKAGISTYLGSFQTPVLNLAL